MPQIERTPDQVVEKETREPQKFKVLLHNDDYTTMEFVVEILISVFNKTRLDAVRIMQHVHHNGIGICGVYPREIAETKVYTVRAVSKEHGFPLKCTMEEE